MLKVAYIRSEAPTRKPTKKQVEDRRMRELGEQFVTNTYERELTKELAKRGLSRAQYELMKADVMPHLSKQY